MVTVLFDQFTIKLTFICYCLQVLDATFDDLVPLAQTKMPEAISESSRKQLYICLFYSFAIQA